MAGSLLLAVDCLVVAYIDGDDLFFPDFKVKGNPVLHID